MNNSMLIESDDDDWFDGSGPRWLRTFKMCTDAENDEQ